MICIQCSMFYEYSFSMLMFLHSMRDILVLVFTMSCVYVLCSMFHVLFMFIVHVFTFSVLCTLRLYYTFNV